MTGKEWACNEIESKQIDKIPFSMPFVQAVCRRLWPRLKAKLPISKDELKIYLVTERSRLKVGLYTSTDKQTNKQKTTKQLPLQQVWPAIWTLGNSRYSQSDNNQEWQS